MSKKSQDLLPSALKKVVKSTDKVANVDVTNVDVLSTSGSFLLVKLTPVSTRFKMHISYGFKT